jgi:D-alanyl-D-alanine carboxypeptidase
MKFVHYFLVVILMVGLTACGSSSQSTSPSTDQPTPTPTPPPQSPDTPETPDKRAQLLVLLDNATSSSNTPGLVMAIIDEEQTWLLSSGVKDTETQVAIQSEDSLRIASMTKLLVATVVLTLAEEGKLQLDGLMSDHLDNNSIRLIDNFDQITIRQLLNMTSGIIDYTQVDAFNTAIENDPERLWQHDEILSYITNQPADFSPGSRWNYSNSNYVLLDLIVATASNTSLAEELRRIIFTPLAMESSYLEFRENSAANGTVLSVQGYEGDDDVTDINDGIGFGDGGVVSTAADLTLFLNALFHEKSLISQASLNDMLTEVMGEEYGLGAEIRTTSAGVAWGHNGASSGFQGDMLYFPDPKRTFVLLSNQADSAILEGVMDNAMAIVGQ